MIMKSKCNQDGHCGHNCAALNNNHNGSFVWFYSDKLLLSLTGLSVSFDTNVNLLCSYIRSIDVPSVCVPLLCVTVPPAGAHPLFEPSHIFCCSSKWYAGSVELLSLLVLSATYKRQPFCTDNTEPRRKACQIIFITSSSSLSLSTSS